MMDMNIKDHAKYQDKKAKSTIAPKVSNTKPRVRSAKKNPTPVEPISARKTPKSHVKGKVKKRPTLLNKSIYRYHFQRTKPKLRRLLEANELLKDELERKNKEMTVLCGDIHNLLERLEPYVCGAPPSNNTETEKVMNTSKKRKVSKAPSKSKPVAKTKVKISTPEKPIKRPKKHTNDKLHNSLISDGGGVLEVSELICNGDTPEKLKVAKKEPSILGPDITQYITHQSQQMLDDFMMESPFFQLKRSDAFDSMNDHDTCNGSLNIIPLLKEPLEEVSALERRGSLELSSEASSADSLSTQPTTTFFKQMKSHLSFFIPSQLDHQLVSINPDKLPPTLPDDIFSET